jgi:ParB/RepB/Spo0J family partition protein
MKNSSSWGGLSQAKDKPNDYKVAEHSIQSTRAACNRIIPDPTQPRKDFDTPEMQDFKKNIKDYGVKLPILVRRIDNAEADFMIVDGECRWRGSVDANHPDIPIIIQDDTQISVKGYQLMLNRHRQALTPLEEAIGLQEFADSDCDGDLKVAAEMLSYSATTLSMLKGILALNDQAREFLTTNKIFDLKTGYFLSTLAKRAPERAGNWMKKVNAGHIDRDFRASLDNELKAAKKAVKPRSGTRKPASRSPASKSANQIKARSVGIQYSTSGPTLAVGDGASDFTFGLSVDLLRKMVADGQAILDKLND